MAMQAGVGSKFSKLKHMNNAPSTRPYANQASRYNTSYKGERKEYNTNKQFSKQPVQIHSNPEDLNLKFKPSKHTTGNVPVTPQHEENVKFAKEEWESIRKKLDREKHDNPLPNRIGSGSSIYSEKMPYKNPDFVPYDIEKYWGEKFLANTGVTADLDSPTTKVALT